MLSDRQILNVVSHELSQSVGGKENDYIDSNRQAALATYLGQPNGKEVKGRSTVVSTDVADAIEWILPEIVKAFTQNNEVVTFDATFQGDELKAELESQYVYDVLMKDNNGFLVLHQFFKDALMQKNGFIKVFHDKEEKFTTEEYTGLLDQELNVVLADPEIELMEQTSVPLPGQPEPQPGQEPIMVHDVKVQRTKTCSKTVVVSVPPEEFRVARQHNSLDLDGCRFCAHSYVTTAGELKERGFDEETIDSIPTSNDHDDDRSYRFYMQDETVNPNDDNTLDPALRPIVVSECYMPLDIDEDGIAEYVMVEAAGGDNPTVILEHTEIDEQPFITSTAILMSHKVFGLSIYDRLKQIQEQKTTVWRNILDNMYLQNNQRTVVVENQVNLDDLLVSRPGGVIRVKRPDAVSPYQTPPLPSDAYRMLDYLDQVRAGRSGVSPEGSIQDQAMGDRVGSEGVDRLMNQKEELVGLMVRVLAETGVKPLCYKIRQQLVKHQDTAKEYKFRGQWIPVNPSTWNDRPHTTVRVGTGSGNRKEMKEAIIFLMGVQEKMLANPQQSLVNETKLYAALNDFAKMSGMASAAPYFLDPMSPEGQQFKQQVQQSNQQQQQMEMEKEKMMAEAQSKIANAEMGKAQATQQNVMLKAQVDGTKNELQAEKQRSEMEIKLLENRLAEAEAIIKSEGHDKDLAFKYWDAGEKHAIAREQIAAQAKAAADNNRNSDESGNTGD